jgi:hypothetical protein
MLLLVMTAACLQCLIWNCTLPLTQFTGTFYSFVHSCPFLHAVVQVDAAAGRDRCLLEAKAGKVKAKLDDALSKASAIEVAPMPKIEVRIGCWL